MKIRYFLISVLSAVALTASADTDNPMYMVVSIKDGNLKVINVDAVDRITFDTSNFKSTDKDGTTLAEYPITSISSIEFNEEGVSGIQTVLTESSTIVYEPQSALLRISNAKGHNLYIYDTGGHLVLTAPIANINTTIDVNQLINGVYIAKCSDVTLKFSKK